jgi:hypothetical protein
MLPSINTQVLPFNLCISLLFSKSSEENRRPENNKEISKNHAGQVVSKLKPFLQLGNEQR